METQNGTENRERVLYLIRHLFDENLKRLDEIEAQMRWRLEFRRRAAEELEKTEDTIRRMSASLSELTSRLNEAEVRRDDARIADLLEESRLTSAIIRDAEKTREKAAATIEEHAERDVYSEADSKAAEIDRAAAKVKKDLEKALGEAFDDLHQRTQQVRGHLAAWQGVENGRPFRGRDGSDAQAGLEEVRSWWRRLFGGGKR